MWLCKRQFDGSALNWIAMELDIEPFLDISLEHTRVASDFFKVLGNENRLIILCALSKHEMKVEMEQLLGIRQPTLSQQLARLRTKDLVHTRRVAKEVFTVLRAVKLKNNRVFDLIGNQDLDFETEGLLVRNLLHLLRVIFEVRKDD